MKKTIKDYELSGKKVIIRCDFNVPIDNGIIKDESRIKKSLKTIKYARKNNAKVILELLNIYFYKEFPLNTKIETKKLQRLFSNNNKPDKVINKIKEAFDQKDYQQILDLLKEIDDVHFYEFRDFIEAVTKYQINKDKQILDNYVEEKHVPIYNTVIKILEHDEIKYDKKYIDLYQQLTTDQVQYNHIQSKKVRKTLIIAIIYFGIIIFIFNQALSSTSQTYNSMQEYINEQYDDLDHVETILEFNQNGWHIGLARSNQDFDSDGSTAEKIVSIMPTYHILSIYEEDGKIIDNYSNSYKSLEKENFKYEKIALFCAWSWGIWIRKLGDNLTYFPSLNSAPVIAALPSFSFHLSFECR